MQGKFALLLLPFLISSRCFAQAPEPTPFVDEARKAGEAAEAAINDALDRKWLTLEFAEGGTQVSEHQLSALRAFFRGLDAPAHERTLYVAGFADQRIENEGKRTTLGKAAVRLADGRIAAVKEAITKLGVKGKVLEVNMARQPNVVRELMGREVDRTSKRSRPTGAPEARAEVEEASSAIDEHGGPGRVVLYAGH